MFDWKTLWGAASGIADPLMFKIKLVALAVGVTAVVGSGLYVQAVFAERATLQIENAKINATLEGERARYAVLEKQNQQIAAMTQKILEAVKRVKIDSNTYLARIEAQRLALPAAGGNVLVPGGLSQTLPAADLPRQSDPAASRSSPRPP